jgi:TonB family protein
MLLIRLDEKGCPSDVRILSNDVHSDFVDAAIAAAKRAEYQPALVNGRPVPSDIRVRIRFQLQ